MSISEHATVILALLYKSGAGVVGINSALARALDVGRRLEDLAGFPFQELLDILGAGLDGILPPLSNLGGNDLSRAGRVLEEVGSRGIHVLCGDEGDYPRPIRSFSGRYAPPLLFCRGNLELLDCPLGGIVGTRRVTDNGGELARLSARAFGEAGVVVVSGGARGVDQAAHGAALDEGGRTVVVLPEGILSYRPSRELDAAVQDGRALLMSEFVPDAPWTTEGAVTRNRTISALSEMVCVIEPKKVGGSIRTARCALEQGKRLLIYGEGDAPKTLLKSDEVFGLVPEGEAFDKDYFLAMWESRPEGSMAQGDLF